MHCPVCSTENPANAKFCFNCGSALGATQAGPARSINPVLQMPGNLRDKMERARVSRTMHGERRIVTILFSDVRGSTALAEQMDPEEWAEIMNGAFERLTAPIFRYEGTVARLMGDAILAFFGAPIAHEDDPRRAVLAALDILEGIRTYRQQLDSRVAEVFDVRVGINTGLVVVGEIGSDMVVEYTAMGDAVNVASRMEQTAVPGTVQIAANTYRAVQDLFEVESLGGIEVKGKSEPVETYRVLSLRQDAVPRRGIEGLHSPLVGREREAAALQEAIDRLVGGTGGIVAVTGEAGLGKSRLIAEILTRQPEGSPVRWLQGRSFSYESAVPFTPFISLLTHWFGMDALRGDITRYSRVNECIAEIMPGRESEISPFIAAMLGIAVPGSDGERVRYWGPPQLRGAIFSATYQLFSALANQGPLVLLFEDLHWADDTSLELLRSLLPLTDEGSVLIIALFRPHHEDPSWHFHQAASRDYPHRSMQIELQPLGEGDARQLVANLLEIEDLPESVRLLILQKAEGNPFFVEEVIRSLFDGGLVVREGDRWRATADIETLQVPDTLAGVITARLDRVPEGPRRVLQAASVVGRDFQHDILADVYEEPATLDPSLADVERRELILEKRRLPDREYSFKHGLTQETAYDSILHSKRRDLHLRVAECLERRSPDRVAENARHFLEARQDVRALPYVVEAGERARRTGAIDTAIGWFHEAIRIGPMVEESSPIRRAYEGLGKSLELRGDIPGAMETYQTMYETADARGDIPMLVSALNKRAFVRGMMLGQMEEAATDLDEAERLGKQARDARGLIEMATLRCHTCLPSADFSAAMESLGSSVDVARERDLTEELAGALAHTASTLSYMTRFDEAWAAAQEGMQLAEELGDLLLQAEIVEGPYVFEHLRRGDLDAARHDGQRALDLARQIGSVVDQAIASVTLAMVENARGEYETAIRHAEESVHFWSMLGAFGAIFSLMARAVWGTAAAGIGRAHFERTAADHVGGIGEAEAFAGATAWTDLGFIALRFGDLDRAADLFERGLTIPTSFWLLERPRLLIGDALVRLARGDVDGATERVAETRAYAAERAMRYVEPMAAFAEGQIAFAAGDLAAALDRLDRAADLAGQMRMRPLAVDALEGAAHVLSLQSRPEEVEQRRGRARALTEEIRSLIEDQQLGAAFDAEHATETGSAI